jgi:glutamine amidotransferase
MSRFEVTVIDYGVGNLLSVKRGFEHWGAKVSVTSDPGEILRASRVVLPGVGAFASAMNALAQRSLIPVIQEVASRQVPLMGICLGMQLLLQESDEFGPTEGLGLILGRVISIPPKASDGVFLKIPHIGWSALQHYDSMVPWTASVLQEVAPGESAYFVHSFMAKTSNPAHSIAHCLYGAHAIPAVIRRENITGCQFHPEKSGEVGLKILRSFLKQ